MSSSPTKASDTKTPAGLSAASAPFQKDNTTAERAGVILELAEKQIRRQELGAKICEARKLADTARIAVAETTAAEEIAKQAYDKAVEQKMVASACYSKLQMSLCELEQEEHVLSAELQNLSVKAGIADAAPASKPDTAPASGSFASALKSGPAYAHKAPPAAVLLPRRRVVKIEASRGCDYRIGNNTLCGKPRGVNSRYEEASFCQDHFFEVTRIRVPNA